MYFQGTYDGPQTQFSSWMRWVSMIFSHCLPRGWRTKKLTKTIFYLQVVSPGNMTLDWPSEEWLKWESEPGPNNIPDRRWMCCTEKRINSPTGQPVTFRGLKEKEGRKNLHKPCHDWDDKDSMSLAHCRWLMILLKTAGKNSVLCKAVTFQLIFVITVKRNVIVIISYWETSPLHVFRDSICQTGVLAPHCTRNLCQLMRITAYWASYNKRCYSGSPELFRFFMLHSGIFFSFSLHYVWSGKFSTINKSKKIQWSLP